MESNSLNLISHYEITDPKTANSVLNRQKRDNGGIFEESSQSASFERECIEEKCSNEEYDETKNEKKTKSTSVDADFKLRKDHLFNGCNIKTKEKLDQKILPYICHPENTQTCRSEYRKVDCVCKPAYLQLSKDIKNKNIVRCSEPKYVCEHGTVIESYFKRKCDCRTNTLNSFLEVGKQVENGRFLKQYSMLHEIALRQNENYGEQFNQLISFGDDKQCSEITSKVGELSAQVGINPCFGAKNSIIWGKVFKERSLLGDVTFNNINDLKCQCLEVQIFNKIKNSWKSVEVFDGLYCQNDIRSKVIQNELNDKNDLCLTSKGNKAEITLDYETETAYLSCTCKSKLAVIEIDTSNHNWQTCAPMKTCGIEGIWSKKVKYHENCNCPQLSDPTSEGLYDAAPVNKIDYRAQFILQGENCSEKASDKEVQLFCKINEMCGMKHHGDLINTDRCELDWELIKNDFRQRYDSKFVTCKCRLEPKYYKDDECGAKSCKDLCNTIDVKLESCDFDYSKPNDPVDCRCIEGYRYAPNATELYASVCGLNSPDQDFIIDSKTGERRIDTGGSLTAVIILGIVGALILISAIMFCFKNKIEACIRGTPADLNNRKKYNTQSSRKGLVTDGSRNSSPKSATEEHDLESQSLKNKVSEENVVSSPVTTHI